MNIRVPETKTWENTHQRFTTVKTPGMVLYVFFLITKILKGALHPVIWRQMSNTFCETWGETYKKVGKLQIGSCGEEKWEKNASMPCLRNLNLCVLLFQTGCLALRIFMKYILGFTLAKHIQTRKKHQKATYTQYNYVENP